MTKASRWLPSSWKFYLFSLITCTVFILGGTLFPSEQDIPQGFWDNDKLVHFLAFLIWTFLFGLYRLYKKDYKLYPVFIAGLVFGALIELLQHLLPIHRSAELFDFIADGLGSGVAVILLLVIQKRLAKISPPPPGH